MLPWTPSLPPEPRSRPRSTLQTTPTLHWPLTLHQAPTWYPPPTLQSTRTSNPRHPCVAAGLTQLSPARIPPEFPEQARGTLVTRHLRADLHSKSHRLTLHLLKPNSLTLHP
jgi:hypothetical protein